MAGPDYSGITTGINKQFDYQRQQAAQQENAGKQDAQDALQRRLAASGGGPGGVGVQQEQLINNQSAQRLQQANQGIDSQRDAALMDIQKTQLGQQFQTGERETGQTFQAGQLQAQFGQQNALQQGEFGQQSKMQQAGFGQQEKLQGEQFGQQSTLQKSQQDFAAGQQEKQLSQQASQFGQNLDFQKAVSNLQGAEWANQFAEQSGVDAFNEKIAQQMADKKDILEQAFGNLSTSKLGSFAGSFTDWANPNAQAGGDNWAGADPSSWRF